MIQTDPTSRIEIIIIYLWFLDCCKDMILRILYSMVFIKRYFQVWLLYVSVVCFGFYFDLEIISSSPQDSSSFSFSSCLPSGWTVLLFSSVTTLISEKIFLDRENFWPTFAIHFSIGLACFCVSSFVM